MIRAAAKDITLDGTPARHFDKRIEIHHPGYNEDCNPLISLLAPDGEQGGLEYGTLHAICAVIADNRFDGHLSTQRSGEAPAIEAAGIVAPGHYWFHVPSPPPSPPQADQDTTRSSPNPSAAPSSTPSGWVYPVVAFFDSWRFPHGRVPETWQQATTQPRDHSLRNTVAERDGNCRLTAHREVAEMAHVVPKSEADWYTRNGMSRYAELSRRAGDQTISSASNMILLRSDVHTLWDNRDFAFVPKGLPLDVPDVPEFEQSGHSTGSAMFVAHVLHESDELLANYHNVAARPLMIPAEYLLARLAWAVLYQIRPFLQADCSRMLVVRDIASGRSETRWYTAKQCQDLIDSRARSRSPAKKAKRSADDMSGYAEDSCFGCCKGCRQKRRRMGKEQNTAGSPADSGFEEVHSGNRCTEDEIEDTQEHMEKTEYTEEQEEDVEVAASCELRGRSLRRPPGRHNYEFLALSSRTSMGGT